MNLVVVVADTLRYDVVHHTYQETEAHVPALDAFRREATSLSAAFGEGEPTVPVRRALATGVRSFPWRYGFDTKGLWPTGRGWHKIPQEQPTIAEELLARGYKTALISDLYHTFKPTMNFTRGWVSWDFVRGQESDNWKTGPISSIQDEAECCVKGGFDPSKHAGLAQYLLNKRAFSKEEALTSGSVFSRSLDWLEDNHDDGPFMLWLEAFDPHEPWDPPRSYADRYCPDFEGTEFIFPPEAATEGNEREQERAKALYLGEVTYVDEWFGRLMDKLSGLGRLDDTVVMFISDHGTELMDHGQFGKSEAGLYAHNTQINWIVRHPELSGGNTVEEFAGTHDIMPTILDVLGAPQPERAGEDEKLAGSSILPLLRSAGGEDVPEALLWRTREGREFAITGWGSYASVRSREWNYIVNYEQPDDGPRLFDLRADPRERHDVISDHPEVAKRYRRALEELLEQELPAKLTDRIVPGEAPCISHYVPETREETGIGRG